MHIPQILYLTLVSISLLRTAHDHGKPRSAENFWFTLVGSAIAVALLWWGGFFARR